MTLTPVIDPFTFCSLSIEGKLEYARSIGITLEGQGLPPSRLDKAITTMVIDSQTPKDFRTIHISDVKGLSTTEVKNTLESKVFTGDTETYPNIDYSQPLQADSEQGGLHWQKGKIRLFQLYDPRQNICFVFDVGTIGEDAFSPVIQGILDRDGVICYFHNAPFDYPFCHHHLGLQRSFRCTQVLSQVLKSGLQGFYTYSKGVSNPNSLVFCAKESGFPIGVTSEKKKLQRSNFSLSLGALKLVNVLEASQIEYAAKDAVAVWHIANWYTAQVFYRRLEGRLRLEYIGQHHCQLLSAEGFPLSEENIKVFRTKYTKALSTISARLAKSLSARPTEREKLCIELRNKTGFAIQETNGEYYQIQKIWLSDIQEKLAEVFYLQVKILQDAPTLDPDNPDHEDFVETVESAFQAVASELARKLHTAMEKEPYFKNPRVKKSVSIAESQNIRKVLLQEVAKELESNFGLQSYLSFTQRFRFLQDCMEDVIDYNLASMQLNSLDRIMQFSYLHRDGVLRAHGQYSSLASGGSYGRTGCKSFSLQILTKPGRVNKKYKLPGIKSIFAPPKGYALFHLDLAASHFCVAEALSGETVVKKLRDQNIKIHFYTTQVFLQELYGVSLSLAEVKSAYNDPSHPWHAVILELYFLSKVFVYSFINLASAATNQNSIIESAGKIVPIDRCAMLVAATQKAYPKITAFIKSIQSKVERNTAYLTDIQGTALTRVGYFDTLAGIRLQFFPEGGKFYAPQLTSASYQAVEAMALKRAFYKIQLAGKDPASPLYGVRQVHNNHDSGTFIVPIDTAKQAAPILVEIIEKEFRALCPNYVGDKANPLDYLEYENWDNCH